ncbi:MAG TPA: hypothetical protein VKF42_06450, partial [Chitinivibrionales bacterium]|nr:hypothetical protein [Chitinivibrionales bacterium]
RHSCFNSEEVIKDLVNFCRIEPRLPSDKKTWEKSPSIAIGADWPRERIVDYLESVRSENPVADLAFTAFRDLKRSPWKPFLKAALDRNPVSIAGAAKLDIKETAVVLDGLLNESIYDGSRLAQPDEVWNYGRGDGLEKAISLLNILRNRRPQSVSGIKGDGKRVVVFSEKQEYEFESAKGVGLPTEDDFVW